MLITKIYKLYFVRIDCLNLWLKQTKKYKKSIESKKICRMHNANN
jgi:hypothetical protein